MNDIDWKDRARKAEDFIAREGYRECDIPACNCGSWHGGNAGARLHEIAEVLMECNLYPKGNTVLKAVQELAAKAGYEL